MMKFKIRLIALLLVYVLFIVACVATEPTPQHNLPPICTVPFKVISTAENSDTSRPILERPYYFALRGEVHEREQLEEFQKRFETIAKEEGLKDLQLQSVVIPNANCNEGGMVIYTSSSENIPEPTPQPRPASEPSPDNNDWDVWCAVNLNDPICHALYPEIPYMPNPGLPNPMNPWDAIENP